MLENVESILLDGCKLVKDRPIIVGVSGGPDSLCLMEVLRQAGYPIIVAHFNHQLRAEAGLDASAVEKTASRLKLTSIIEAADVQAHAQQKKLSIEEAARNLRYRFFFRLAHDRHAQAVAVGHTADDQVETVLMHFLRGGGLGGLKGMTHRSINHAFDPNIPVVRPLLGIWREETVGYCATNGLHPRYDSSNDSLDFQRNRIRHSLVPILENHNPKFRETILRMSEALRGDHELVMEALAAAWRETVTEMSKDVITFDASLISERSIGLQRNLIKRAVQSLRPGLEVGFATVERACTFIRDPSRGLRVDLKGGLRMFREVDKIHVCTLDADLVFNRWPQMTGRDLLPVPETGHLNLAGGWRLSCERGRVSPLAKEQATRNDDPFRVWLDADVLPAPIQLRTRLRGDHFEPLGMAGHSQKLSDFMVNEKIPQRLRDRWPLLCSGKTIIWVPGYRPANPFRLTDSTENIHYFSVSRPPETLVK